MSKRKYRKVQELLSEIEEMIAAGSTHKEIEAHFQLEGNRPIHQLLKRERRKAEKAANGIIPRRQGCPRKNDVAKEVEKENEIKRLMMENELLRDFLRAAGRK